MATREQTNIQRGIRAEAANQRSWNAARNRFNERVAKTVAKQNKDRIEAVRPCGARQGGLYCILPAVHAVVTSSTHIHRNEDGTLIQWRQ
jgi:hypothetical protein